MANEEKAQWEHPTSFALAGEASADLLSVSNLLRVQTQLLTENLRQQELARSLQAKVNSKRRRKKKWRKTRKRKKKEGRGVPVLPAKLKKQRLARMEWVLFGGSRKERPAELVTKLDMGRMTDLETRLFGWVDRSKARADAAFGLVEAEQFEQVREQLDRSALFREWLDRRCCDRYAEVKELCHTDEANQSRGFVRRVLVAMLKRRRHEQLMAI